MKKLPKITYQEPMALAKWSVWDSNRKVAYCTDSLIHAIKYCLKLWRKQIPQEQVKHKIINLEI